MDTIEDDLPVDIDKIIGLLKEDLDLKTQCASKFKNQGSQMAGIAEESEISTIITAPLFPSCSEK